jgi:ribosomal protein S12 methylthiotransferase accessory factor
MVHADYAPPEKPGHGLFPASTNGLASGNQRPEALAAAICEAIERDALAVWHRLPPAARARTRLNLGTVTDPTCRWACGRLAAAGLVTAAWDVTSDLGIAAFLALVSEPDARNGHIGLGSGADPDAGAALARALFEAAQTRLTYISGSRDDLDAEEFTVFGRAQKRHMAEALLGAGPPQRDQRRVASFAAATVSEELDWLLGRLVAGGIEEVVAVDLGREDAGGIAVARLVIPGLEAPHDDPGYVPGPRARAAERTA